MQCQKIAKDVKSVWVAGLGRTVRGQRSAQDQPCAKPMQATPRRKRATPECLPGKARRAGKFAQKESLDDTF